LPPQPFYFAVLFFFALLHVEDSRASKEFEKRYDKFLRSSSKLLVFYLRAEQTRYKKPPRFWWFFAATKKEAKNDF